MNTDRDPIATAFRSAFDAIVEPLVEVATWDEVTATVAAEAMETKHRVWWRQPIVVAAVAALAVLATAIPLLLFGAFNDSEPAPAVSVPDPVTTTLPSVTDETPAVSVPDPVATTQPSVTDETPAVSVPDPVATTQVGVTIGPSPLDPNRPVVLMDVARQLECLPLDASGWAQSEPLPMMDEPPAVSLAANDDAAVVVGPPLDVGGVRDEAVVAYWSNNGLDWQPVEGIPSYEALAPTPPSVDGGARGFVAVVNPASLGAGEGQYLIETTPVVLFSPDGGTWEQIDPQDLPAQGVKWISDVTAGPVGFIITGRKSPGEDFVWSSPDGRNWFDSTLSYIDAVVPTERGWAALRTNSEDGLASRVWRSTDGVFWNEAATENAPPPDAVGSYFKPSPMVLDGNTWALVNGFHEWGDATAWVSTDAGTTWNEHPIGGEYASLEHNAYDLAATPAGLLLTGRHDLGSDDVNLLHYSVDGTTWHHCETWPARTPGRMASSAFTEIAMLGETMILLDNDTGTFHTWTHP